MFAKLFETQPYGQVLVRLDQDDEGRPALHWSVQPPGLGVCTFIISFSDDDEGWDQAEAALAKMDEGDALKAGASVFSQAAAFAG